MKILPDTEALSRNSNFFSRILTTFVSFLGKHADFLAITLFFVYSAIWSAVLILLMNNFQIGIYDYGVAYNLLWRQAYSVPSYNSPFGVGYLSSIYYTKVISYLLVPVMWIYPSIYNLLIVQSLVFGASGFIVYLISKDILKSKKVALLMETMWLIYYPVAAANVFPFHYQTLLDPFYLFGFYMLISNRKAISLMSFSLSMATSLLAPLILVFTIPSLWLLKRDGFLGQKTSEVRPKQHTVGSVMAKHNWSLYFVLLILAALGLLAMNYFEGSSQVYSSNIHAGAGSNMLNLFLNRLANGGGSQFLLLLFLLLPLAFLPVMNKYFLFPMIPPALYYLVGYYPPLRFYYPMQYGSLIAPQLFISTVLSIHAFWRHHDETRVRQRNIRKRIERIGQLLKNAVNGGKPILLSFIILNIALASVYSPLGPFNPLLKSEINSNPPANGGYGVFGQLAPSSYSIDLSKMISMIPQRANVTVLSQFNIPQIAGRQYFTFPGEFNPSHPIDYAINDPQSAWFFVSTDNTGTDFHNFNMFQISNMMLSNSSYGVYAQSQGAILFKHNYSGNPLYFVPVHENVDFRSIGENSWLSVISVVSPGYYNVTITGSNSNNLSLYMGSNLLLHTIAPSIGVEIYVSQYMNTFFEINGSKGNPVLILTQTGAANSSAFKPL